MGFPRNIFYASSNQTISRRLPLFPALHVKFLSRDQPESTNPFRLILTGHSVDMAEYSANCGGLARKSHETNGHYFVCRQPLWLNYRILTL